MDSNGSTAIKKNPKEQPHWGPEKFWDEYTDRNTEQPSHYDLNALFSRFKRGKILEVGSNRGLILDALQNLGHTELYGIEPNAHARSLNKHDVINGSAYDIPFKDGYFDTVFTSGVLIHLEDPVRAMKEIIRCSKKYIIGIEYYSKERTKIPYRNQDKVPLWKDDFCSIYQKLGLTLIEKERLKYPDSANEDELFLLTK